MNDTCDLSRSKHICSGKCFHPVILSSMSRRETVLQSPEGRRKEGFFFLLTPFPGFPVHVAPPNLPVLFSIMPAFHSQSPYMFAFRSLKMLEFFPSRACGSPGLSDEILLPCFSHLVCTVLISQDESSCSPTAVH